MSSPSEVGGEVPSARFRGLLFASAARGHPATLNNSDLLGMREHIVVPFELGIVRSLCPNYAGRRLQRKGLLPHRLQPMLARVSPKVLVFGWR